MGDLAVDTAVEGRDGRYTATPVARLGDLGPERRLRRGDRAPGRGRALAVRPAGLLVGHFLGVADFDAPLEIETTTLREAKRAAVDPGVDDAGAASRSSTRWCGRSATCRASSTTSRRCPTSPSPRRSRRPRNAIAGRGEARPHVPVLDQLRRARQPNWIDDWENREPGDPSVGRWYRFLPTSTFDDPWVDACRSRDPARHARLARRLRASRPAPPTSRRASTSRWRSTGARPEEPWLYAAGASRRARAGGLIGCESRVWARDGTLLGVGASQLLCRPAAPIGPT